MKAYTFKSVAYPALGDAAISIALHEVRLAARHVRYTRRHV